MPTKNNEIIEHLPNPRLILASASPRRLALLRQIGLQPIVMAPSINESILPGESPTDHAQRLAGEKAFVVAKKILAHPLPAFVLGADTVVSLGSTIYGKPRDENEARQSLKHLSGKTHCVTTGYVLLQVPDTIIVRGSVWSTVTMKVLSEDRIRAYLATGEPMDKAGAYAAQGLGAELIEKIDGSLNNVVGLPVEELKPWFRKLKLI